MEMNRLLALVAEHDLLIQNHQYETMRNDTIQKLRSTNWMKDPNKPLPDTWRENFGNWRYAHEQKEGYRVESRLPLLETFELNQNIEEGFLFPSDELLLTGWLQDEVHENGIEALAWYHPFHISPQHEWGITITDRGIWYLAKNVMSGKYEPPYTLEQIHDCFELAYEFLYYHELFHFKVEYAATILELNSPHKPMKVYAPFWDDGFYHPGPSNCSPLEEAMANEYARWKVCRGQPKVLNDTIERFMQTQQPSGYRDFKAVKHNQKWEEGLNALVESMIGRSTPFATSIFGKYQSHIVHEDVVPVRVITTGLPDEYAVRLMSIAEYCRTSAFEGNLRKIKKKNALIFKQFQKLLKVISQNNGEIPRSKNNKWEPHLLKGLRPSQKVELCYLGGPHGWRVYREMLDGIFVFRSIHKKTDGIQEATKKAIASRPLSQYDKSSIIHQSSCLHL